MEQVLHAVTPYGRGGGSSRVRVFDWLERVGADAAVHDYAGLSSNAPRMLMRNPRGVLRAELGLRTLATKVAGTTVLISKQASPFSRGGIEERLLRRAGRGVYDVDDSLADEHPAGGPRTIFPKARIWRRAVSAADVIIAGNDYLADQAQALHPAGRVTVIPSCVDPGSYVPKTDYAVAEAPIAVWIGSPSTEAHLSSITAPLLRVHRSHGLRLLVISGGQRDLGPLTPMVDRLTWTPAANRLLARADVGLMPLPDTPQTRGKCAYKLLQYGAAALPAIASPVGANAAAIDRGVGQAAADAEQWRSALEAIVEEPAERRRARGVRALDAVTAHYSFDAWADRWRAAVMAR